MARITVEDGLEKIPNRFQLMLAVQSPARTLSRSPITCRVLSSPPLPFSQTSHERRLRSMWLLRPPLSKVSRTLSIRCPAAFSPISTQFTASLLNCFISL